MSKKYIPTAYPDVRASFHRKLTGIGSRPHFKLWSDAKEKRLVELCETTMSYRLIAVQLNSEFPNDRPLSRNAVLGKACRHNLRAGKPQIANKAASERVRRGRMPKRPAATRNAPTLWLQRCGAKSDQPAVKLRKNSDDASYAVPYARRTPEQIASARLGRLPDIIEEHPLTSKPVTDCERGSCMWPTSADIRCMEVCGAPSEIGAYCARHAAVAYRVMPTRSRNATFGKIDNDHRLLLTHD